MINIVPATGQHLSSLWLRQEDADEVSFGWRGRVLENLSETLAAVEPDGTVVALFGLVPGDREVGVWMLASDAIKRHRGATWRIAKRVIDSLRQEDRLVFNYIPKHSTSNRRFVERLGFRILHAPHEGPDFFYLPKCVNRQP